MRKFSLSTALVAFGVFVVLLISPMFRQALRIAEGAWTQESVLSQRQLRALENDARKRKDAELLAWTALRLENSDRVAIAQEAVAMDQRLTWIYYPVCAFRQQEQPSACASMVQQLKAWAPDNAVPWLMEASYARSGNAYPPKDAPPTDATWRAAMDQAFASPKYDSYRTRRIELERRVYKAERLNSPVLMLYGMYAHPIPDIRDMQWEAKRLVESDPAKVATFASVMERGAQSDIERIAAFGLTGKSGGIEAVNREWEARMSYWRFAETAARVVQFSMLGLLIGMLLLLGALGSRLARIASAGFTEICGVFGAAIVGVSSVAMYVAYWPYAEVLRRFLAAPENRVDEKSMAIFGDLMWLPFLNSGREAMMVGVWTTVLIVGVAALVWMGKRMFFGQAKEA